MDVTGLDLAQLGTAVSAIAAALKAMKGNRDIVKARTETRTERNGELQRMQLQIVESRIAAVISCGGGGKNY